MATENAEQPIPLGPVMADRYRVGKLLGRGATAAVYEAVDAGGQVVAIKVLNPVQGAPRMTREHQLLLEAQLSMRLSSPHAVKLFEVGVLPDGRPFLVMERLVGKDLAHHLLERGPMPVADACDIALQACHALAEAHRLGVVHRDIKPANLFLSARRDGTLHVKVLDFGLASLVSSESAGTLLAPGAKDWRVAGSPGYAAPEQIGSQRSIDERADVWALGIVLYELVLGRRPFEGATLIDTLIAAGSDPVPPMGPVPKAFEAIVRRCLEKDRERRFPNVVVLAEALAPLAPPALADYPDLVRQAGGCEVASAESTQRIVVEEEAPSSRTQSRVNSGLLGPTSGAVSSQGRPDSRRSDGTSSFVAQVLPQAAPWAGVAVVAAACVFLITTLVLHAPARGAPARTRRAVAPPPAPSSMLLAPLPRAGGSAAPAPSDWSGERPPDWQEVP